jgi:hypothetical protein
MDYKYKYFKYKNKYLNMKSLIGGNTDFFKYIISLIFYHFDHLNILNPNYGSTIEDHCKNYKIIYELDYLNSFKKQFLDPSIKHTFITDEDYEKRYDSNKDIKEGELKIIDNSLAGHAILFFIKNIDNKYIISIVNSGLGIENHNNYKKDDKEYTSLFKIKEDVSLDNILLFFNVCELLKNLWDEKYRKIDANYKYNDNLKEYVTKDKELERLVVLLEENRYDPEYYYSVLYKYYELLFKKDGDMSSFNIGKDYLKEFVDLWNITKKKLSDSMIKVYLTDDSFIMHRQFIIDEEGHNLYTQEQKAGSCAFFSHYWGSVLKWFIEQVDSKIIINRIIYNHIRFVESFKTILFNIKNKIDNNRYSKRDTESEDVLLETQLLNIPIDHYKNCDILYLSDLFLKIYNVSKVKYPPSLIEGLFKELVEVSFTHGIRFRNTDALNYFMQSYHSPRKMISLQKISYLNRLSTSGIIVHNYATELQWLNKFIDESIGIEYKSYDVKESRQSVLDGLNVILDKIRNNNNFEKNLGFKNYIIDFLERNELRYSSIALFYILAVHYNREKGFKDKIKMSYLSFLKAPWEGYYRMRDDLMLSISNFIINLGFPLPKITKIDFYNFLLLVGYIYTIFENINNKYYSKDDDFKYGKFIKIISKNININNDFEKYLKYFIFKNKILLWTYNTNNDNDGLREEEELMNSDIYMDLLLQKIRYYRYTYNNFEPDKFNNILKMSLIQSSVASQNRLVGYIYLLEPYINPNNLLKFLLDESFFVKNNYPSDSLLYILNLIKENNTYYFKRNKIDYKKETKIEIRSSLFEFVPENQRVLLLSNEVDEVDKLKLKLIKNRPTDINEYIDFFEKNLEYEFRKVFKNIIKEEKIGNIFIFKYDKKEYKYVKHINENKNQGLANIFIFRSFCYLKFDILKEKKCKEYGGTVCPQDRCKVERERPKRKHGKRAKSKLFCKEMNDTEKIIEYIFTINCEINDILSSDDYFNNICYKIKYKEEEIISKNINGFDVIHDKMFPFLAFIPRYCDYIILKKEMKYKCLIFRPKNRKNELFLGENKLPSSHHDLICVNINSSMFIPLIDKSIYIKMLGLYNYYGMHDIIIDYFKGMDLISEEDIRRVKKILYNPTLKNDYLREKYKNKGQLCNEHGITNCPLDRCKVERERPKRKHGKRAKSKLFCKEMNKLDILRSIVKIEYDKDIIDKYKRVINMIDISPYNTKIDNDNILIRKYSSCTSEAVKFNINIFNNRLLEFKKNNCSGLRLPSDDIMLIEINNLINKLKEKIDENNNYLIESNNKSSDLIEYIVQNFYYLRNNIIYNQMIFNLKRILKTNVCREIIEILQMKELIETEYKERQGLVCVFEIFFGYIIRDSQIKKYNEIVKDFESVKKYKVHQFLMGRGKSSVITPLLYFYMHTYEYEIDLVVPNPLLNQTLTDNFFFKNIFDIKLYIMDDFEYKCMYVDIINMNKEDTISTGCWNNERDIKGRKYCLLIDEFDSLYDPIQSNFNLVKEKKMEWLNNYWYDYIWIKYLPNKKVINIISENDKLFINLVISLREFIDSLYINLNYGMSNKFKELRYVIPYARKDTPIEQSQFSNPVLTILLTIEYFRHNDFNLEENDFKLLFKNNEIFMGEDFSFEIENIFRSSSSEILIAEKLKEWMITKNIGIKKKIIYIYINKYVLPNVQLSCENINCSFMDIIGNRFDNFKVGYTGTVHFEFPKYPESMNNIFKEIIPDYDEFFNVYYGITMNNVDYNNKIYKYNNRSDKIFNELNTILNNCTYHILIDSGAIFRDNDNLSIIMKIKDLQCYQSYKYFVFIDSKDNTKKVYDKISNNIFFYKNEVYETGTAFYYYSQKNTVGIDIKQPTILNGLVTISNKNTYSEIAQAMFRCRKINKGHTVDFFIDNNLNEINNTTELYDHLCKKEKMAWESKLVYYKLQNLKSLSRIETNDYYEKDILPLYLTTNEMYNKKFLITYLEDDKLKLKDDQKEDLINFLNTKLKEIIIQRLTNNKIVLKHNNIEINELCMKLLDELTNKKLVRNTFNVLFNSSMDIQQTQEQQTEKENEEEEEEETQKQINKYYENFKMNYWYKLDLIRSEEDHLIKLYEDKHIKISCSRTIFIREREVASELFAIVLSHNDNCTHYLIDTIITMPWYFGKFDIYNKSWKNISNKTNKVIHKMPEELRLFFNYSISKEIEEKFKIYINMKNDNSKNTFGSSFYFDFLKKCVDDNKKTAPKYKFFKKLSDKEKEKYENMFQSTRKCIKEWRDENKEIVNYLNERYETSFIYKKEYYNTYNLNSNLAWVLLFLMKNKTLRYYFYKLIEEETLNKDNYDKFEKLIKFVEQNDAVNHYHFYPELYSIEITKDMKDSINRFYSCIITEFDYLELAEKEKYEYQKEKATYEKYGIINFLFLEKNWENTKSILELKNKEIEEEINKEDLLNSFIFDN